MRNFVFILALLFPVIALAAPTAKPAEIVPYIHAEKPVGSGELSRLWIKAYDASLWTDAPVWSMQEPFALSMHYAIGLDTDDLVGSSIDEMQHVSGMSKEQLIGLGYKEKLAKAFPPVKDGDTITAVYIPQKGTMFFYNGQPTGTIAGAGFAEKFFAIWLSPNTSQPKLRQELLGLPGA